jgi:hypothetical protein
LHLYKKSDDTLSISNNAATSKCWGGLILVHGGGPGKTSDLTLSNTILTGGVAREGGQIWVGLDVKGTGCDTDW